MDNLEMSLKLQRMSLETGEETGVPGGNPPKHGEHMQTPHTQGGGGIQTPNI